MRLESQFIFVCLILISLFAMAAGNSASGQAADPPPAPAKTEPSASRIEPPAENHRFPNGQTYFYEAEWRLWKAGTAALRMETAGTEQRVTGTADSVGFVSLLYSVHDRLESFFNPRTFCSSRISKHTEEGVRKRDIQIHLDYGRQRGIFDEKNLNTGESKHTEHEIPACVTDVISAIYYVASLPLQPGRSFMFPVNDGSIKRDVRVTVEAREDIKTDAGTFRTLRVQPESDYGLLHKKGKMWLWYSDDAARIPVQMRAHMFWGTLTVRLQRVERH